MLLCTLCLVDVDVLAQECSGTTVAYYRNIFHRCLLASILDRVYQEGTGAVGDKYDITMWHKYGTGSEYPLHTFGRRSGDMGHDASAAALGVSR